MKKSIFFFTLLLFATANSYGQESEEMTAKKYDNVEWYIQSYFKLEPARYDSASLVLKNHLVPATIEAGINVNVFQYPLGEWQYMLQFQVDGPEVLTWEVSPFTVELMKHLKEQEGGEKSITLLGGINQRSKSRIGDETYMVEYYVLVAVRKAKLKRGVFGPSLLLELSGKIAFS